MDGAIGRRLGWLLACAALGCGPTVQEPITRLATCGQDGPVRVVEHGPDWGSSAQRFGDELVVRVFPFDWAQAGAPPTETWVVGACGDEPRRVALDLEVHPRDDLLIACDWTDAPQQYGDIVRVDPSGESGPTVLFEDVDCSLSTTEHGWLAANYEQHELWLQPDPHGEAPAELLADDFERHATGCPVIWPHCDARRGAGSAAYYINVEHEAVQLDLVTGERTVVQPNASWVWLSPDGWLWWKERGDDDDGDAAAPVHMTDLSTGRDEILYTGERPLRDWPITLAHVDGSDDTSLVDMEEHMVHPLPPGIAFVHAQPGVDALLETYGASRELYVWSRQQERAISRGPTAGGDICEARFLDDLTVLRQPSCDGTQGEVWTRPYDGADPRLLATDVSGNWTHVDGRIAWSPRQRAIRDHFHVGDLFVSVDTDERLRLDDEAHLGGWGTPVLDGDVLYTVNDGDRSGLWRTATR